jgi:SAM-dependent methyltransferase
LSWAYSGGDPGIGLFSACLKAGAPMTFTPGMRVLEVGACESNWLELARAAWPEVEFVGFDQRKGKPREGVIKGDGLNTDLFPAESFDAVVSLSAIEHFGLGHYKDPLDSDGDSRIVANVWRWLKPGGWFYFDVPYDPTGYRVQGTKCRVYDDGAIAVRLWLQPSMDFYAQFTGYSHAKAAGTLVPKPTDPVKPFHYVAMVWRKA